MEELNVIVAIPEAVLDDADYNIWNEVKPLLLEAYGLAFDQAVFYGVNAPYVWPTNIVAAATAAGNFVTAGSVGGLYDDVMGENGLIAKVEEDGNLVNWPVCGM